MHGVKKEFLVFVAYLPPSYTSLDNAKFFEKLIDAMTEARSKTPDSWIILGETGTAGLWK